MRPMRHMAAAAILIALATPAAGITFPWTAQQRTPAKACITSARRGDLVEALGQLEAAREARDPQLCEAWAAVLDGLNVAQLEKLIADAQERLDELETGC